MVYKDFSTAESFHHFLPPGFNAWMHFVINGWKVSCLCRGAFEHAEIEVGLQVQGVEFLILDVCDLKCGKRGPVKVCKEL